MRDLKKYISECIEELRSVYGIDCGHLEYNIKWKVSKSKRTCGVCWSINGVPTEIHISSFLLDEEILKDDIHLKDTIIHEMIHALYPRDGHGGRWQKTAKEISSKGKYKISITASPEEMGIAKDKMYKYIIKCPCCGGTTGYSRKCRIVNHPEWYICTKCGHSLERAK